MSPARVLRSAWKHRAANAVTVATLAATVAVLLAAIAVAHNFFVSPWTYDTTRLGVLTHRASADTRSLYGFSAEEYRTLRDSDLFDRMVASRAGRSRSRDRTVTRPACCWCRPSPRRAR
ncbi:MAG: hypothetical protein NVV68_18160 [Dokdonella sp.]|nr:hypothetical protein [Dokdonella sp.]